MSEKVLLRRKEAAEALGLSVRSLDYLVAQGRIRPRRFGRRVLFERHAVERLARRDLARIVREPDGKR